MRYQPLDGVLTLDEEENCSTQRVTRTDPNTGMAREFEEWVEITKSIQNPLAVIRSVSLREVLWELEGLSTRLEANRVHGRMLLKLDATPRDGYRAPTTADFIATDQLLIKKMCDL